MTLLRLKFICNVAVIVAVAIATITLLAIWLFAEVAFSNTLHWRARADVTSIGAANPGGSANEKNEVAHWEVIANAGFLDYMTTFLKNSRNAVFCSNEAGSDCSKQGTSLSWARYFYIANKSVTTWPSKVYQVSVTQSQFQASNVGMEPVPASPSSSGLRTVRHAYQDADSQTGVIYAFIFPTHPTEFTFNVAHNIGRDAAKCYLLTSLSSDYAPPTDQRGRNGWLLKNAGTSDNFQAISDSNCDFQHQGDWTFKMPDAPSATDFAPIVNVPVASRSSIGPDGLNGRYALYLLIYKNPAAAPTLRQTPGQFSIYNVQWKSGFSYLTAPTINPSSGGYNLVAHPDRDAVSSMAMAGEIQFKVGNWIYAGESTPSDNICVAKRMIWTPNDDSNDATTNGRANVNMLMMGITKRGQVTPWPYVSAENFAGSNWAIVIRKADGSRIPYRMFINTRLNMVERKNALDWPRDTTHSGLLVMAKSGDSVTVQIFDFDYLHPTLGDGSPDSDAYCSLIDYDQSNPNHWGERTVTPIESVPWGIGAESYFTTPRYGDYGFADNGSSQDPTGQYLTYRYPAWTQITANLLGETQARVDMRPWELECHYSPSTIQSPNGSYNRCNIPYAVDHFIPVMQWRSSNIDMANRARMPGTIKVSGWAAIGTGETSDGGNDNDVITEVNTGGQYSGVPTPGARLPGVNFVENSVEGTGVPAQYIFLMVGLGLALFAIAALQRMFNNVLISVVGGGMALAIIAAPSFGFSVIWVVAVYGIVGAAVVVIGDRVSTGY